MSSNLGLLTNNEGINKLAKYHFLMSGGLGDALLTYCESDFMRRLPSIKQHNPDLNLVVYSQVSNEGITDMFHYHPAVTRHVHIPQLPQFGEFNGFDRSLIAAGSTDCESFQNWRQYPVSDPVFNLHPREESCLDLLFADNQPVIVIQPFAGMPVRDAFNWVTLNKLLRLLPGRKIIIGRSSCRTIDNDRRGNSELIHLESDNEYRNDVINLIDKVGIRFTWHLMKRCHAFVGTHSCMVLLAWMFNKPTVCTMPHWVDLGCMDPRYLQGIHRENTLMARFETETFEDLNIDKVNEHIRKFVK